MLECLPSVYLSDFPCASPSIFLSYKPSDKPSPAPSNAPSVGNIVEGCVIGGGKNNVCLASNPVVGVGGNNTILEAEVDGRQLQVDNLGTHTITAGSMNKIQCPGPSSTITGGSFNSITNQCEYSTMMGGTGKFYLSVSFIIVVFSFIIVVVVVVVVDVHQ